MVSSEHSSRPSNHEAALTDLSTRSLAMSPWWFYLVAIPAVAFSVNGIPHYVHGIGGLKFPTPFSGGAGTLDGPVRNVFWGGGNLIVGGLLLWLISPGFGDWRLVAELVVLALLLGALLGMALSRKKRPKAV